MRSQAPHNLWAKRCMCFVSGFALPFSMAPYNYWMLAIVCPAVLTCMMRGTQSRRYVFELSLIFGIGMFASGASWVYVSIHDFGFTGVPLAIVLTSLFVLLLASAFTLPFVLFIRIFSGPPVIYALSFACLWVFGEWLRSWLFTGFPWLYLGYAHLDSQLASWAPLIGVFGVSFASVLSGTIIFSLILGFLSKHFIGSNSFSLGKSITSCTLILSTLWIPPYFLKNIEWTHAKGEIQSVALMQPNIELYKKWNPIYFSDIFEGLYRLSDSHWDKDIQIWPEAAIPSVYNSVRSFTDDIDRKAQSSQTNVFSGVLYDKVDSNEVYNSIIGIGTANGTYFKQKLVPFGEYVPFEEQLRGLINFFDLPNSVILRGPFRKKALSAQTKLGENYIVAPYICYEVVYPDFVASLAGDSELMLTISNDAWFGKSSGPLQHFEMVRMRALENQKYMLRSTNTGVSGIIDEKGKVLVVSEQFKETAIEGFVELRQGETPFSKFGSKPILALISFILIITLVLSRNRNTHIITDSFK